MDKARWPMVKEIRQRIMCEAYDLADRDDSEGYNAIKVMCSDVIQLIDEMLDKLIEQAEKQEPVAWFSTLPDGNLLIKISGRPTKGNWEPLYQGNSK